MSEKKRETSKLCLTGFILSILFPVMLLLVNLSLGRYLGGTVSGILNMIILLFPLTGLILSIAGLVSAFKKRRKGKGLGIAGIILNTLYIVIGIVIVLIGSLAVSAFLKHDTKKTIPTYYSDSEIVSVRYYYWESDGYRFEELDEDRLDDFVDDLDSMVITHGGLLDYYWGGNFGIEMELEDGTYLTYDGTRLTLRSSGIGDEYLDSSNEIRRKSDYVYVENYEFWDVMEDYFPSIEENGDKVFSK